MKKNLLVVRTNPVDGKYKSVEIFRHGQSITPQKLSGVTFRIDEILG